MRPDARSDETTQPHPAHARSTRFEVGYLEACSYSDDPLSVIVACCSEYASWSSGRAYSCFKNSPTVDTTLLLIFCGVETSMDTLRALTVR
jgi:hypothetical protein